MKLTCIVDNYVEEVGFWGEWGLSFLVESQGRQVLFDTAQTPEVFMHNVKALGLDLSGVDALVLSHGHFDHTGGLAAALPKLRRVPLYLHPAAFRPRKHLTSKLEDIGMPISRETLEAALDVRPEEKAVEVVPGVWTTGYIAERTYPDGGSKGLLAEVDGQLVPDDYADDLSLVLDTGESLVLLCGCCHAGLLNTIAQVRRDFGRPISSIIGGTHLGMSNPSAEYWRQIIAMLSDIGSPQLYLSHCSGFEASLVLAQAFPGKVHGCSSGRVLRLSAAAG
jgi:7,8-dihydropterin-6-yl-methyl-4-(beta-D-ribofuranosyl)aminobenzene 5'-phosphate synthase